MTREIRGRIIRILDEGSVIINLGRQHGVTDNSVFAIVAGEEAIIDPDNEEILGYLRSLKGKVKAHIVEDGFTVAKSSWERQTYTYESPFLDAIEKIGARALVPKTEIIKHDIIVNKQEMDPLKLEEEADSPVSIGDTVIARTTESSTLDSPESQDDFDDRLLTKIADYGDAGIGSDDLAEELNEPKVRVKYFLENLVEDERGLLEAKPFSNAPTLYFLSQKGREFLVKGGLLRAR